MAKQIHDPGTGTFSSSGRMVNKDGTFNVKRIGALRPINDVYHYLVNIRWPKFLLIVFLTYSVLNTIFAFIYLACGVENFNGIVKTNFVSDFLNCFFFSAQSLTTVGYGNISPNSHLTQLIASFEALMGVMSFALITGLFYGRFSKPVARVIFSNVALVAPFKEGKAIMIRVANKRKNILIDCVVNVLFSKMVTDEQGERKRQYFEMPLQFNDLEVLPLSWTIVHPIDDKSPFWNYDMEDLKKNEGEIFIQFKAFDDTFHQVVASNYSYGKIVLDLNSISDHKKLAS
jgi:inward rectifier potassium channel